MTPDQMRLRAVAALAEEFDRTHEDPSVSAERFLNQMMRRGWRPIPALAEGPPPRPQPSPRKEEFMTQIRDTLSKPRGQR